MRRATDPTVRALGVYAALVALQHGVAEFLQGGIVRSGLLINAIGPPCEPGVVWHACLPAMSLLPTLRAAGVATAVLSLILIGWCAIRPSQKRSGLTLGLFSVLILLAGGGFVAPFNGLVAAAGAFLSGRFGRASDERGLLSSRGLATLWPWTLLGMGLWLPGAWVLGHLFPATMVRLSFLVFFFVDLLLPIVTVLGAIAQDANTATPGATTRAGPGPERFA